MVWNLSILHSPPQKKRKRKRGSAFETCPCLCVLGACIADFEGKGQRDYRKRDWDPGVAHNEIGALPLRIVEEGDGTGSTYI